MGEELITLANRAEWRAWLEKNHNTLSETWLTILKKNADAPGVPYEDAVEEAVCFGWIDGKMHTIDDKTYALRFTPRRRGSIWSKSNRDRATFLICAGFMAPAGLQKVDEAKQNGMWEKAYSSLTPPAIPQDVSDAMASDGEAMPAFKAMSNSMKTRYLYWIESAKREDTRKRRIQKLMEIMRESS